jgi:uncharacterized Fe-S cluster-containing radical SAM superfamily protein
VRAEALVAYAGRQRARIGEDGFWPGVFSVMDLNLMCALLWGEARGMLVFRAGRWLNIVGVVDRWQSGPSLPATPPSG